MTRSVVLHGHFYQPPREEPWLELVPRERSAAPYHDWNERITAECYAPLTGTPVLDDAGRVRAVYNAYAWCSFDAGPTLLRWFDAHAPAVGAAIVAGDGAARTRLGHGNAIAAPYHHIILPLASRRDKVTEVRWGIRDFQRRFGRDPIGMWLPETAVDDETLEVVAQEGIRFTILAPHQVSHPAPFGRPARWRGTEGRELAVFTYDGPISHEVAFSEVMRHGDAWARRFTDAPASDDGGPTIISLVTDGETFGHHHKDGDRALATLIDRLSHSDRLVVTNFAALLAAHAPTDDITLNQPTSWSCAHGVERWRSDCGCRMDPGSSQAWRVPLRTGLEIVKEGIHAVVEREWPREAGDLWVAREAAGSDLAGVASYPPAARGLLEAEHHALAMFTSCGWFFDDLGRIEPRLILRHAARALEFLPDIEREALEAALLTALAHAHSNDPTKGDGVAIWHRDVLREADGPMRLAAGIAALRELAPDALADVALPSHEWRLDGDTIMTIHRRTGRELAWMTTPIVLGVVAHRVHVRATSGPAERIVGIDGYPAPIRDLLDDIARPMVLEATLDRAGRDAVREGRWTDAVLRDHVLRGAWTLAARDGLDDADVVVHAALDLYALEEAELPPSVRADAFRHLVARPASRARSTLAERFGLALPGA